LPTVAVHEFAIHPTAGELVAATPGRRLWGVDVTSLPQMTPDGLKAKGHLYKPNTAVRLRSEPAKGSPYGIGSRHFFGQNPPSGAQIFYSLTQKADKVSLKVVDIGGQTVRELQVKNDPGLHRVTWELARVVQRPAGQGGTGEGPRRPASQGAPAEGGPQRQPRGGPQQRPQPVPPGIYRLVLTVAGQGMAQKFRVENDPALPATLIAPDEEKAGEQEKKPTTIDD